MIYIIKHPFVIINLKVKTQDNPILGEIFN